MLNKILQIYRDHKAMQAIRELGIARQWHLGQSSKEYQGMEWRCSIMGYTGIQEHRTFAEDPAKAILDAYEQAEFRQKVKKQSRQLPKRPLDYFNF